MGLCMVSGQKRRRRRSWQKEEVCKGRRVQKGWMGRVSRSEHALWGMTPLLSLLVSGEKTSREAVLIASVRIQRRT